MLFLSGRGRAAAGPSGWTRIAPWMRTTGDTGGGWTRGCRRTVVLGGTALGGIGTVVSTTGLGCSGGFRMGRAFPEEPSGDGPMLIWTAPSEGAGTSHRRHPEGDRDSVFTSRTSSPIKAWLEESAESREASELMEEHGETGSILVWTSEQSSEVGTTLIWTVSNEDVGSSPRRHSGGAKDSVFTWSTSPTPRASLEGSVERCDDSELREEEEQGEDGSDFT